MAETVQAATLVRAAPRTVGTHFLAPTDLDAHECRATCYRISSHHGRDYVSTLCDYGHAVSMRDAGPRSDFGGSAFQASLNDLPARAPFILAPNGPAGTCALCGVSLHRLMPGGKLRDNAGDPTCSDDGPTHTL